MSAGAKRLPPGPLDYGRRVWMRITLLATFVFLYAPIVTLVAFSFNDSRRNIVWRGFTFKYYEKAWNNDGLIEAFTNSLTIAFVSTLASTVLGTLVAVALWRFRFPFKGAHEGAMALPIVIPEICMGVAMLAFFARIGWPSGLVWPFNLGAITIAHISFSFPFVAVVVRARLASFNRELDDAARDLGASEWQAFKDVLVPHMRPGLVAGALLAFTLSLDDFVITFFTSGPGHGDVSGEGLLDGPVLGDPRGERGIDDPDRDYPAHHQRRAVDAGTRRREGRTRPAEHDMNGSAT